MVIKCAVLCQVAARYQVAYFCSGETASTGNRDPLGEVVRAEGKTMDQFESASVHALECVTGVNCVALKH